MKIKKLCHILLILLFLLNSCATKALWKKTDPDEYIKINFTEITEQELQKRKAKYIRDDHEHAFYVTKDSFDKFKDYTARTLGTPVTLVIDATAIVIFAMAFSITNDALKYEGNKGKEDSYFNDRIWGHDE
jgi:hypothetical protein